ncbi:hypothetical protein EUGRSUZ_G00791, partial [Eucalyptus grandis]
TCCLDHVRRRLGEEVRPFQAQASTCTIFRIPLVLRDINHQFEQPEIVSIGPLHRGQKHLCEFEEHKWFFLKIFLRRTDSDKESLIKLVADQESSARGCYSEDEVVGMSSSEFVEMMLLDGCFVVEFMLHIFRSGHAIDVEDPILTRPLIIRTLIRDLLKLENQVPYSLLKSLFDFSRSTRVEAKTPFLCMLALRVFNQAYPRPMAIQDEYTDLRYRHYDEIKSRPYKHLLDLFNFTLFPRKPVHHGSEQMCRPSDQSIPCATQLRSSRIKFKSKKTESSLGIIFRKGVPETNPVHCDRKQKYRPSDQSIPCVTQLRPSGIKFKSKKTESFLDISFPKRVLEIPPIAIDDFMTTVLINCIALEKCQENSSKHITDYVSFMHCLIKQSKDVSLLCSDGIISTLSRHDQYVVNLFEKLGKSIDFNVCDCYLSKQFEELESYYYSNWASMIRTYFSSPWSVISVFSAFLIIALTITQTVYAVLGQHSR